MTKAVGGDIMVQTALPAAFPDGPAGTARNAAAKKPIASSADLQYSILIPSKSGEWYYV